MMFLLLKVKFISETDNGTGFEFQCQINHEAEWNVEFSIPYKLLFGIFLFFAS